MRPADNNEYVVEKRFLATVYPIEAAKIGFNVTAKYKVNAKDELMKAFQKVAVMLKRTAQAVIKTTNESNGRSCFFEEGI